MKQMLDFYDVLIYFNNIRKQVNERERIFLNIVPVSVYKFESKIINRLQHVWFNKFLSLQNFTISIKIQRLLNSILIKLRERTFQSKIQGKIKSCGRRYIKSYYTEIALLFCNKDIYQCD